MRAFNVKSDEGIRAEDIAIFRMAAKLHRVYILLRATNPLSVYYMGVPGYSAKAFDCKAKTADYNVAVKGKMRELAGLVVDFNEVPRSAFKPEKVAKAEEEWLSFEPLVARRIYDESGKPKVAYHPHHRYRVQMDPSHRNYGCVIFSPTGLATAGTYIHGDYDLYAIVPADAPAETMWVNEKMLGFKHVRSKELLDVQTFINSRIGRPLILHGDQEKYKNHEDDTVYVFSPVAPDITVLENEADIRSFYANTFQGRKTGGKNVPQTSVPGTLWNKRA